MLPLKEIIESVRANCPKSVSLFYFHCGKLLQKNYQDVFTEIDNFTSWLNKILNLSPSLRYVGILFMRGNIVIPVFILGCIKFGIPFVCLDNKIDGNLNCDVVERLHVSVIFALHEDSTIMKKSFESFDLFGDFELWNIPIQVWLCGDKRRDGPEPVITMLYAVQTSGSTGQPKIVQVPEQTIVPNIAQLQTEWKVTKDDVILLGTPPTFDPFMVELLLAATVGAALLVVPADVVASTSLYLDTVFPSSVRPLVTIAQFTPSVFMRWTQEEIRTRILNTHTTLRVLALGGEKFPPASFLTACREPGNLTQLYNLYGTTELSCWAMIASGDDDSLGTAMSNTLLRVEDDAGSEVLNGTGQLFIGSDSRICVVGDECWQTLQIQTPVFRATGDIVTVKEGGVYQFQGRKDSLIKRWGHRVSLNQIENVAMESAEVTAASCVLLNNSLALFVSLRNGHPGITAVRALLKPLLFNRLNKASIPDFILEQDKLPLNRHGKVNKNKLKKILSEMYKNESDSEGPEEMFKDLWIKYTIDGAAEDVGFLSAGGNSVTAMQIMNTMTLRGVHMSIAVLSEMLNNKSLLECNRVLQCLNQNLSENEQGKKRGIPHEHESISKIKKTDSEVLLVQMKGCCNISIDNIKESSKLSIAWSYNLGKCVDASPTCIVYNSEKCCVVVGSHSGKLAALDFCDGSALWQTQLPDRIESSLTPSSCGTLGLIGCYDGNVYCVSLATGDAMWSFKTQAIVKGIALLVANTWIFGSYDYSVSCLQVSNGELLWRHRMDGIVLATPQIVGTKVVVASLSGQVVALQSCTGDVQWTVTLPAPVFSSPSVVAGLLVVADVSGTLHGLHPASGFQIWQFKVEGKIFSSLAVREDMVFFGCDDNGVYALRCSQEAATLAWRYEMGSSVYSTPCLVTNHHIAAASTAGQLSIIGLAEGLSVSSLQLPGQIFSSPIAFKHSIVLGCRDDNVYCIEIKHS